MECPKIAMLIALVAAGNVMNTSATETVTGLPDPKSSEEQRISDLVQSVAKLDITSFEEVSRAVPGAWQFERSLRTTRVTTSLSTPWLSGRHELFVEENPPGGSASRITSALLTLRLRDGVCFSGKHFNRPEYALGIDDHLRAQPMDSMALVTPYLIEGRRVAFTYPDESECVQVITFTGKQMPDGSVR